MPATLVVEHLDVTIYGRGAAERARERGYTVAWTPCHYGGSRPWLLCPGCGRRRAKLYPPEWTPEGGTCRVCLRFGYRSRSVDWRGRRELAALKIRERLGGAPDLSRPFPRRRRGMRRATYAALKRRGVALEAIVAQVAEIHERRAMFRGPADLMFSVADLRAGRADIRRELARLRAVPVPRPTF